MSELIDLKPMPTKKKRLSNLRIVAIGYFLVALTGTFLLHLPISSISGETTFLQALFTAVSASSVTGLVLVDTATHWSFFGQIVILLLIQVGGMGFMTIGIRFVQMFRHRVSLREREVLGESLNVDKLGGILQLSKHVFIGTLLIEGIGALLLSVRFIPMFGIGKGIFYSIFHSISAFCNAGFDLMGVQTPFISMSNFYNDWYVNMVLFLLITIGGIGFVVWEDLAERRFRWKKMHLHTKVVLFVSAVLTFGGAVVFFLLEKEGTGAGLTFGERVLTAFFHSVSSRTAGFNTVDTGAMTSGSKIFTMMLMFIGGSPGSTAGGIKTTTFAVLILFTFAGAKRESMATAFGRSIDLGSLHKAVSIIMINLACVFTGMMLICAWQPLDGVDVMFEVFSAMGTVGMSAGITREMTTASSLLITLLMFLGRVGSVSLAGALLEKKTKAPVSLPTEKIIVG